MIKILTDSTCDLPPEVLERYGITVIPLRVHFGTESFLDGVTISKEEFFDRLPRENQLPTTSQPSAGEFCEAVKVLADAGHEVVGIFISGDLSGTIASAHASCELTPSSRLLILGLHRRDWAGWSGRRPEWPRKGQTARRSSVGSKSCPRR